MPRTVQHVVIMAAAVAVVVASSTWAAVAPVRVSLRTSWNATHLLDEARCGRSLRLCVALTAHVHAVCDSEAVAAEDPCLFFAFAAATFDTTTPPAASAQVAYELVERFATQTAALRGATTLATLRLGLATHEHSALVKAHHQVYEETSHSDQARPLVVLAGEAVSEQLVETLKAQGVDVERTTVLDDVPLGHVYNNDGDDTTTSQATDAVKATVVLYGLLGEALTKSAHDTIVRAIGPGMRYVFRHRTRPSNERAFLAGFGVELAIKSTEYKAVDDAKIANQQRNVPEKANAATDMTDDEDASLPETVDPIQSKDLMHLAPKFINHVLGSPNPLRMLRHLSQNLPSVAASIASLPDPPKLTEQQTQTIKMQMNWFGPALTINGLRLQTGNMDSVTVYNLLPILRQERKRVEALVEAGIPMSAAVDLIINSQPTQRSSARGLVIDIRDAPVLFLNDVEKDAIYSRYPSQLESILMPMYGGQMAFVRANLVTTVFVVAPTRTEHWQIITRIGQYMQRGVPLRFGLWFLPEDPHVEAALSPPRSIYAKLMRCLQAISEQQPAKLVPFLIDIARSVVNLGGSHGLTDDILRRVAQQFAPVPMQSIFDDENKGVLDDLAGRTLQSAHKKGVTQNALFVNGQYNVLEPQFESELMRTYYAQIEILRQMLNENRLKNGDNIYDLLLSQPTTFIKFAPVVYPSRNVWDDSEKPLPFLSLASFVRRSPQFYAADDVDMVHYKMTSVLVGDWSDTTNLHVLQEALAHVQTSELSRLSLIDTAATEGPLQVLQGFLNAVALGDVPVTLKAGDSLRILASFVGTVAAGASATDALINALADDYLIAYHAYVQTHDNNKWRREQHTLFKALGLGELHNHVTIITNGRVITGPAVVTMDRLDFAVLETFEYRQRTVPIAAQLEKIDIPSVPAEKKDGRFYSDLIAITTSAIGHNAKTRAPLTNYWPVPNSFHVGADAESCILRVDTKFDPFSADSQRLAGVLLMLERLEGVCIHVSLHYSLEYSELPIKRYYRYAITTEPAFDHDGDLLPTEVTFHGVPADLLLTMGIDEPQSWLVGSASAVHDLDNLKLSSSDDETQSVKAVYELEKLVIEGHAFETNTGFPPRGLQLVLGSPTSLTSVDTIVMANMGYFQLQANPGPWQLRLRKGRSANLYQFSNPLQPLEPCVSQPIVISSFVQDEIFAGVRKKPGRERENLLSVDNGDKSDSHHDNDVEGGDAAPSSEEHEGVWGYMKNSIFGKSRTHRNGTVHVFSLASGHLYERLMRIMMLSVLRHTNNPVKFWIIQNFASPQFKELLPLMAEKYKFDFEFVTYKWPRWLNAQTEKQRIIWAYKILFLDVLFPLDVDKIIFVDADEIVRADLNELASMDLQGAPYGYTPFCDSRRETDGFRFWKQGWWQQHLASKPYHISALYVIDLRRFREIAAGDRLRHQYNMLSSDPNSLANLDQDLPNNMQHELPIFSLPQEWLFCETWCADADLSSAKVIDLCNNPLTKEPKLAVAQRLLPEWTAYDQEIREFQNKLVHDGRLVIANADTAIVKQTPPVDPSASAHKHDEL